MDKGKLTLLSFLFFNIFLIIYSVTIENFYAIRGQIGFLILAVVLFELKTKLKMRDLSYILLLIGIGIHLSNVFGGFYYHSPIFLPWDYLTHFIPFMAISIMLFDYFKEEINNKNVFCFKNLFLFLVLFLATNGVGVIIELTEYSGYMILGAEKGSSIFGGGDFDSDLSEAQLSESELNEGGWYDSMEDLFVNCFSSLITLLVLFVIHFQKK